MPPRTRRIEDYGDDDDRRPREDWSADPNDDGADYDDREDPDPRDQDDDDAEEGTTECPACGAEIYEYAQQCPACGKYVSEEDPEQRRRIPMWIWVGVILALIGSLMWARY